MRACAREAAVIEMVRMGHWPAACDEELRAHIASCRGCAEIVQVKAALGAMQAQDKQRARLEAPGVLLWRAQLRRRRAAMEQAARPIVRAYLFAMGMFLVAVTGIGAAWWFGDIDLSASLMAMTQGLAGWTAGVVLAAMLVAAGTVAYFVGERD